MQSKNDWTHGSKVALKNLKRVKREVRLKVYKVFEVNRTLKA
jgi:hypothetical protein